MNSRPKLPPRRGQQRANAAAGAGHHQQVPDVIQLKQQLLSHPVFQQLADQPDKLAAIIQADPVLQQAAASNPELAHLLDPATMQQALEVIMQPNADVAASAAPQLHRAALMQLQNYAMQLQQARGAGTGAQQQQQQQQVSLTANPSKDTMLHSHNATSAAGGQSPAPAGNAQQQQMWLALQQRFNKLQQRSQMLGAAGFMPYQPQQQQQLPAAIWPAGLQPLSNQQQPRVLETLVESPLAGGTPTSVAAAAAEAVPTETADSMTGCADRHPRVSDGTQTMQELLAAFPDMLGPPTSGPLCGSHATIGLMSAVEPPTAVAADSGAVVSQPQHQGQVLQQLELSSEVSTALPVSPIAQHLQQHQQQPASIGSNGSSACTSTARRTSSSGKSVWPLSGSDPAVAAGAISRTDSSTRLAAAAASVARPASALGHRILRPHSSSPIPLDSGSTPLGIAQLGSGELIVDITPPTKITTELSWSLDPDASYVLDASTSGSLSLPAVAAGDWSTGHISAADSTAAVGGSACSSTRAGSWDGALHRCSSSGGGMSPATFMGVVVSTDGPGSPGPTSAPMGTAAAAGRASPAAADVRWSPSRPGNSSGSRGTRHVSSRSRQQGLVTGRGALARRVSAPGADRQLLQKQPTSMSQQQNGSNMPLVLPVSFGAPAVQSDNGYALAAAARDVPGVTGLSISSHGPGFSSSAATYGPGLSSSNGHPPGFSDSSNGYAPGFTSNGYAPGFSDSNSQPAGFSSFGGPLGFSGNGDTTAVHNPKSYYEDVLPSTWRPDDASEYPGDYLELYRCDFEPFLFSASKPSRVVGRRAYCSYADALFPPLWLSLIALLATSKLLAFLQLLLVGCVTFWGGMYVMAVRWAGVPRKQLSLSRVAPMMVVSLEVMCFGVFLRHILPSMWLGHSALCLLQLVAGISMLALHLAAHLQDPGYIPLLDTEEGPYAHHLSTQPDSTNTTGPAGANTSTSSSKPAAAAAVPQQPSSADLDCQQNGFETSPLLSTAAAAVGGTAAGAPVLGPQRQQQQQGGGPKLAGRSLTGCWTCGVERNLRSKHCPICKRCVERFDHHCPVIGNCVGAKNHKTCVTYLMALVICQLLFVHSLSGMLVQQHIGHLKQQGSASVQGLHNVYQEQHVADVPGRPLVQLAGSSKGTAAAAAATVAQDAASRVSLDSSLRNSVETDSAGSPIGSGSADESGAVMGLAGLDSSTTAAAAAADSTSGNAAVDVANTDYSANIVLHSTTTGGIDSTAVSAAGAAAWGSSSTRETAAAATTAAAAGAAGSSATAEDGSSSSTGAAMDTAVDAAAARAAGANSGPAVASAAAPAAAAAGGSSSSAAEFELLLAGSWWSWRSWWLYAQALWSATETSVGLLLVLLLQVPCLFITCSLLFRALFLAAANLTVNEWLNRHRYIYLQHSAAGFCNRFDRGPVHNCWEFWFGPAVVDWWDVWRQADEEMKSSGLSVLTPQSVTLLIRFWDKRWAKYQQKLMAARERKRERQVQRRMVALGLISEA